MQRPAALLALPAAAGWRNHWLMTFGWLAAINDCNENGVISCGVWLASAGGLVILLLAGNLRIES